MRSPAATMTANASAPCASVSAAFSKDSLKQVAHERERRRPDPRAEDAPGKERPQRHAGRAVEERRDGAHDPDEPADEDRPRPVLVEEPLHPLAPLHADAEACAVAVEPRRPQPATEQEARDVAAEGAEPRDRDHDRQRDLAPGSHDAAERQGGLARRDEPDERAGLQERQRADERVGPDAERVREVAQELREVRQLDDARQDERVERAGDHGDRDEQPDRRPAGGLLAAQPHAAMRTGAAQAGAGAGGEGTAGARAPARGPGGPAP